MRHGLIIVGCATLLVGCAKRPVRTHLVSETSGAGFIAAAPVASEDGRWVAFDILGREGEVGIRHENQGAWHANRDGFKWKAALPDGNRGLDPDITADGQWVVYVTDAPLMLNDRNHIPDVYMWRARDTNHNSLKLVSVGLNGRAGDGAVYGPAKVSPDGRYVAWTSHAMNYIGRGGDPDGPVGSIFIRDMQFGKTSRVPVTPEFRGADTHIENVDFQFTEDGQLQIAFETGAGLIVDDSNGVKDVYVVTADPQIFKLGHDKHAWRQHAPAVAGSEALWHVELVSVGPNQTIGDGPSYGAHIAHPATVRAGAEFAGRPLVFFTSEARTLSLEKGDFEPDVFVQAFDPTYTGLTPLPPRQMSSYINETEKGKCVVGDAENVSGGDVVIAMTCRGPLLSEDDNHIRDVYVRSLSEGPVLASRPDPEMDAKSWTKGPPKKQIGNAPSGDPDLSGDGCHVAFASESRNLTNEYDEDPHTEVFSRYNPMRWKTGELRTRCGWVPRDEPEF